MLDNSIKLNMDLRITLLCFLEQLFDYVNCFLCPTVWLGIQRAWSHLLKVIFFCKTLEFFATIWWTIVTVDNLGNSMWTSYVWLHRSQTCWNVVLPLGSLTDNLSPEGNSFHLREPGLSQLFAMVHQASLWFSCAILAGSIDVLDRCHSLRPSCLCLRWYLANRWLCGLSSCIFPYPGAPRVVSSASLVSMTEAWWLCSS